MTADAWIGDLSRSKNGTPHPNHANIVLVLQHDPMFAASCLWYDEFADRVILANSPTREWRDDDDTRVAVDMQDRFGIRGASCHVVADSIRLVARQRPRHPVREYLVSLAWDGIPRIATAFADYWGAAEDDYTQSASRNFFIGLVARILRPGCKLDTMPVFEGPQGIRKSSALAVLGGIWHSVAHENVGSKDFLQGFRGKWVIEIAELQSFTRADVTAVKNMLSTASDDYRPSYGRHVMTFPRQCVMAGTTNADDWGTDDTGLRRFWPIRCGDIKLDLLGAVRDQLFAEAVVTLNAGGTWWEMPLSTAEIQLARQHHDEWTEPLLAWCALQPTEDGISIQQALVGALKVPLERIDKFSQMRAARILKLARWERRKVRVGAETVWRWLQGGNIDPGGNGGNIKFVE